MEDFFMYPMIDLHCDTIYSLDANEIQGNIIQNDGNVDLRWMEKAGNVTTCFALFVELGSVVSPFQTALRLYHRFETELHDAKDRIKHVRTASEIQETTHSKAILSIEELQILEGDLDRIALLADWGVRLATLTWNYENDLGFPHHLIGGLKPFGFEAIGEMEAHNILVDVSHLNDQGFYDVAKVAKKPFIASHSNCRAITNQSRNLSDRMIKTLADHGGVVGLNFCPSFLSEDWNANHIEDMVRHVVHLKRVGGRDVLAIGTDFDGVSGDLDIKHYDGIERLRRALEQNGFTTKDLEAMWYDNALRVLS
ncbi:dipeptidase [Sphaerochaeta sp.]|uniref:dipeptidase n=1 Tax=Sphaerochaeta sp. TaxID=1972642 RepID=UPI002FCB270C